MFSHIGELPRLPAEIGLVLREHLPQLDQVHLRRAIESGRQHPDSNVHSLPFAHLLPERVDDAVYLRSVPLFLEFIAPRPYIYDGPYLMLKNAPSEVVELYSQMPEKGGHMPYYHLCRAYGRYDLIKMIHDRTPAYPLVPPEIVHRDVVPEAIESVYRSYPPNHRTAYARLVAKAARVDALRFIHSQGHPVDVAVSDVVTITDTTIQTMHWIRMHGKPWKTQQFDPSIFQSLRLVKWLDRNGYDFDMFDWYAVFHESVQPNRDVVTFLFEKDVQIPNYYNPSNVSDAIDTWRQRQHDKWRYQLATVDAFQSASPHIFPDNMVMRAPHDVARLVLQSQPIPPDTIVKFNRYDLLTPAQIERLDVDSIRDDQAEALDKETLIMIYESARPRLGADFFTQLMVHGRVDVLSSIPTPPYLKIFDAFYTDLSKAKRTITWARDKKMPWGAYFVPVDQKENSQLTAYYRSIGAPL